ncbi:putative cryptochrome/photolyase domain superfamily [Helianthus anomalus]
MTFKWASSSPKLNIFIWEVAYDEIEVEVEVEKVLKDEGVEVKYYWGSTLYHHIDDLPFELEDMPSDYGGFKEKVKGLKDRESVVVVDQLRGLPARGDVEPGEIPSLVEIREYMVICECVSDVT